MQKVVYLQANIGTRSHLAGFDPYTYCNECGEAQRWLCNQGLKSYSVIYRVKVIKHCMVQEKLRPAQATPKPGLGYQLVTPEHPKQVAGQANPGILRYGWRGLKAFSLHV